MLIYNYNSTLHKFKDLHDETGGRLQEFAFQYYDCFCGGKTYKLVSTATRHRNHFNVVQCRDCGTLRINPYLSDASIETYYREVYGPVKRKNIAAPDLFRRQAASAGEIFSCLSPFVKKGGTVLDYGGGAGGRMEKFLAEGYAVSLHDYDRHYLEYGLSKGMKEFSGSERYDLIVLRDVIEHVNYPVEFLKEICPRLSDGGAMYIEAPLFENTEKLLKDFHLAHKFYFTLLSLIHLANMAGLKTIQTFHNAILVTPGAPAAPVSLDVALATSNRALASAWKKETLFKPLALVKQTFKKSKSL